MNTTGSQPNASMAYLLGGVGLLAISVVPLGSVFISEVQPIGKLAIMAYWLLGALVINWAVRRFSKLAERVVAVVVTVIGWYILLAILMVLETVVFRF